MQNACLLLAIFILYVLFVNIDSHPEKMFQLVYFDFSIAARTIHYPDILTTPPRSRVPSLNRFLLQVERQYPSCIGRITFYHAPPSVLSVG